MIEHTIRQGDCINSIAHDNGFLWKTIWDHGANAELKQLRKDPSVINPGDIVRIPDIQIRQETGATEQRHRFRKKGTPAKVKIQVKRNDEPRANVPYKLEIDGKLKTGTTDGQGMVEMQIPPNARRGELRVGTGNDMEVYPFQLGAVDSIDTEDGARQRLRNLGFDADAESFAELLKAFQGKHKIQATGQLDQATQDKLKQEFGE